MSLGEKKKRRNALSISFLPTWTRGEKQQFARTYARRLATLSKDYSLLILLYERKGGGNRNALAFLGKEKRGSTTAGSSHLFSGWRGEKDGACAPLTTRKKEAEIALPSFGEEEKMRRTALRQEMRGRGEAERRLVKRRKERERDTLTETRAPALSL